MAGLPPPINDMQKLLRHIGIPRSYWGVDAKKPLVFVEALYRRYNGHVAHVTAEEQELWFRRLVKNPRKAADEKLLIVIGSMEADFAAMSAATILVKKMAGAGVKVYAAPVMTEERVMSYQDWKSKHREVLLLYNVTPDSPKDHMQRLRNWIVKYDHCTRIVVCGGINPIELMEGKLFYRPIDMAFFVEEDRNFENC